MYEAPELTRHLDGDGIPELPHALRSTSQKMVRVRKGLDASTLANAEIAWCLAWSNQNVFTTRIAMVAGLDRFRGTIQHIAGVPLVDACPANEIVLLKGGCLVTDRLRERWEFGECVTQGQPALTHRFSLL